MVKYDVAFKLKIVEVYLANEGGYKFFDEKFGVPSRENIILWIKTYSKWGLENLNMAVFYLMKNLFPVSFKLSYLVSLCIYTSYSSCIL